MNKDLRAEGFSACLGSLFVLLAQTRYAMNKGFVYALGGIQPGLGRTIQQAVNLSPQGMQIGQL